MSRAPSVPAAASGSRRGRGVLADDVVARLGGTVELRQGLSGPGLVLSGYASVFDTPYEAWDWLGPFTEVVDQGAFTGTLADGADVRLLVNHEGLPLARTSSGTLRLAEDQHGLHVEADLDPTDPDVALLTPKMRRGDVKEMSFAFQILRQQWSPDFEERHIKEVKLFDVSVVTFPANPATTVTLTERARRNAPAGRRHRRSGRGGMPLSLAQAQAEALRLEGLQR